MPSPPLLATKLHRPVPRRDLVRRERLEHRFDAALLRRLTVVSAPAGFGKSTLASAWIEERGIPSAWLSLESGDNDVVRFLRYLLAALRTLHPDVGAESERMLAMEPLPPVESILTPLVNELVSIDPFLLVLDDYQVVELEEIHEAILVLVERAPPSFHLVLLTRLDPPIPLARLRTRGGLVEIRAADLRFTRDEIARLFESLVDLPLGDHELDVLSDRTEGWIAGLQMTVASIEGMENELGRFIEAFGGTDRYILDFLLEEVLSRQRPEVQHAMLALSILDSFDASLCHAVTGYADASGLLRWMDRGNLFLVPLDSRGVWYRYHHLFRDLLRHTLEQRGIDPTDLHRRAAEWYRAHGDVVDAAVHARQAIDVEMVIAMVEENPERLLEEMPNDQAVLDLLSIVPADRIESSSRLALVKCWGIALRAEYDEIERLLAAAERGLERVAPEMAPAIRAEILYLRAVITRDRGDAAETAKLASAAIDELRHQEEGTERNLIGLTSIRMILAVAFVLQGETAEAEATWLDVLRALRATENTTGVAQVLEALAQVSVMRGELAEARSRIDEAAAIAAPFGEIGQVMENRRHQLLARIAYERNELELALEEATIAYPAIDESDIHHRASTLQILVRVHAALGDSEGVRRWFDEYDRLTIPPYLEHYLDVKEALRITTELDRGETARAVRWVEAFEREGIGERGAYFTRKFLLGTYLRALLLIGRHSEAIGAIEEEIEEGRKRGHLRWQIEGRVLRAAALELGGEHERAMDETMQALLLASGEGHVRPFFALAGVTRPLLQALHGSGTMKKVLSAAYVEQIVRAFSLHAGKRSDGGKEFDAGMLTERELEILRMLARGDTNRKIAENLHISINTVKAHLYNLFTKMGVENRTEAVAKSEIVNGTS